MAECPLHWNSVLFHYVARLLPCQRTDSPVPVKRAVLRLPPSLPKRRISTPNQTIYVCRAYLNAVWPTEKCCLVCLIGLQVIGVHEQMLRLVIYSDSCGRIRSAFLSPVVFTELRGGIWSHNHFLQNSSRCVVHIPPFSTVQCTQSRRRKAGFKMV